MNLLKKLDNWEQAGLMTEQQKKAIIDYEHQNRNPRGVWVVLIISALFIGTGIISLIAANWGNIPGSVKIGADWLILAAVAGTIVFNAEKGKNTAKEFWLVTYALLILGSIGLTAQVFQIQSDDLRGWFIWSLLLIPLLPWSQKPILAMVWVPVFVYSGFDILTKLDWFQDLSLWIEKAFPGAFAIIIMTASAFIYSGLKQILQKSKPQIVQAWGFWLAFFIAAVFVLQDIFSANSWSDGYLSNSDLQFNATGAAAVMLCVCALIWLEQKRQAGKIFGLLIAVLSFFLTLLVFLPHQVWANQLWGAMLTLSALAAVMVYACRRGRNRLLNWAAGLAILRIFIIYLQVFGSLLLTGIGLISSGLVLLGLLWGWNRLRHSHFFNKTGGLPCQNGN